MKFNKRLSQALAVKINPVAKQCYHNSWMAMIHLELAAEQQELLYCEGWAISGALDFPIQHGWLQVDSNVVDISPGWRDDCEHKQDVSTIYHPVWQLEPAEFSERLSFSASLPLCPINPPYEFYKVYLEIVEKKGVHLPELRAQIDNLKRSERPCKD